MVKDKENRLLLVTGNRFTQKSLAKQLMEFLPEEVPIVPYLVDEISAPLDGVYFTVFSSKEVYDEFLALGHEKHIGDYIIGTRTVINTNLDKILTLPRDQAILLATDSKISALESIRHLQSVGFDFLQLIPYYPGCPKLEIKADIAITPGDHHHIPHEIQSVYNIGTRLFDLATMIRIMAHYGILEEKIYACEKKFMNTLFNFATQISNVADETSKVMKTVRTQLAGNGYFAKYHFDDIIGESTAINHAKAVAEKIARTNLTVLIEGENGTGKELFASSIHNASLRNKQPFVAINCSALPDQLIESELFGYEDGAFTGARKGGKIGLFQQASGGTIFLDEIGDISLKMQSKLLRVFQEREIMKVGGDRIIPIDVRIIAATNKDLSQMIEEKAFRKDLYYRLKEGYIHLPDLSERVQDIPLLINHWRKERFHSSKEISPLVMEKLMDHYWPGNVRELLNVMKFAFAVSEKETIQLEDLPFETRQEALASSKSKKPATPVFDDLSLVFLSAIRQINQRNEIAGRNRIYWYLKDNGYEISEYKIRKLIPRLSEQGLISTTHGKYGLSLTDKGVMVLDTQNNAE